MTRQDRTKRIKLLLLDVDGVLTDGKIILDSHGVETKVFDVQDGFGLVVLKRFGFKTAILTARVSKVVALRAKDLRIDKVYQDAYPKIKFLPKILKDFKVCVEEVCFVGDDWPDVAVMKRVGFAVAVANAAVELKKVAHYVTKKKGGAGAIREVIELIMKDQGRWQEFLTRGTI